MSRRRPRPPAVDRPPLGAPQTPSAEVDQLLTPEQLANRWQIGKASVYRFARSGSIPCVRLGKAVRFRLDAIEDFERQDGAANE